ncbi:MAG: TatD family hydrolase [Alphaproteobacteria bacterium]|nr:TatD family hydrolase [Alphaproteobacteria bacterium]
MLIDSHCHLDYPDLAPDLSGVMARAANAGVGAMLTIGTRMRDFPRVRAIAEAYPHVFCSVGIHPHEAANESADAAALVAAAAHPRVVGIGETGLDYFYDRSPRPQQQDNFRIHVAAAQQTGLPLIVHTRDADQDTAAILREAVGQGPLSGVLHCFTSSQWLAEQALALGFYVSISGIITFKNADELRRTVRSLPLDRLLVETDAPFLAPVPMRGRPCEPAFVAHTAAKVAELKGISRDELAARTTANFRTLFPKAALPAGP